MTDTEKKNLKNNIAKLKEQSDLSYEVLASEIGISKSSLQRLIKPSYNGDYRSATLLPIAKYFCTTLDVLKLETIPDNYIKSNPSLLNEINNLKSDVEVNLYSILKEIFDIDFFILRSVFAKYGLKIEILPKEEFTHEFRIQHQKASTRYSNNYVTIYSINEIIESRYRELAFTLTESKRKNLKLKKTKPSQEEKKIIENYLAYYHDIYVKKGLLYEQIKESREKKEELPPIIIRLKKLKNFYQSFQNVSSSPYDSENDIYQTVYECDINKFLFDVNAIQQLFFETFNIEKKSE